MNGYLVVRTLVVHCHPNPQSFNTALFHTTCQALSEAGHEMRRTDLYAENFQPIMSCEERVAYLDNPGLLQARVAQHVDNIRWAEHLVFVFPTWFYGPPAMLKGWLERVWLPGVAFLPAKSKGLPAQAGMRHIRRLTVVTTSGSPRWWLFAIGNPGRRLFLRGLRATFALRCRTTWLQMYNMNHVTREDCSRFLQRVAHTLRAMP